VLQLFNQALIPVLIFAFKFNVADTLLFTGIASLIISTIFLAAILWKLKWSDKFLISTGKELLGYGLQRIPGDMALAGFFAVPAIIVAHTVDLTTAGYVAFGISLMNIVGAAFGPISLLQLPKSVGYIADKNYKELKKNTSKIFAVTLTLTFAGVLIFELFANWIIRIYLGNDFSELVLIVRIIMVSSIGYVVYITLRSVLDAYHFKAINTKNIFIAFLIFLAVTFIAWQFQAGYLSVLFAFVISMFFLGYLTYSEYKNIFINKLS